MKMKPGNLIVALVFSVFILSGSPAPAFYDGEKDGLTLDARAYLRVLLNFSDYPDLEIIYPDDPVGIGAVMGRLLLSGDVGQYVSWEFNGYQQAVMNTAAAGSLASVSAQSNSLAASGGYRWNKVRYDWYEEDQVTAGMEVDRLNLRLMVDPVDVTVGRQAINLSVTNLWAPNDFFQPFVAQAFNTVYKPGVDAARINMAIGNWSGISLIGALGYDQNLDIIWQESAFLGRAYTVLADFEWALIGGKTAWRYVAGGSFQGEIGPIGVRGEGHAGFPIDHPDLTDEQERNKPYAWVAGGIDHRWANSVHLMGEYFYHGTGETGPDRYQRLLLNPGPVEDMYLGRHYGAAAISYEPHPLVVLFGQTLVNVVDPSGLASAYVTYSLSDEADFVGGALVPFGRCPEAKTIMGFPRVEINSEYSLYPVSLFLQIQFYL